VPEIYLNGLARALGSARERNDTQTLGQSKQDCERLSRKTGIRSRVIASEEQYTSDLACTATGALLASMGLAPDKVRALMVCTQTPDHLIPGVSSLVHGRLSLARDCFVIDLNQGCSGFVLGTQLMTAWLRSHGGCGVLVNADVYSRLIRKDDLTTRILFGDAATATLFSTRRQGLRVIYNRSFADGTGYESFVARGSAIRPDEGKPAGIFMDGPGILNFALRAVPEAISCALADLGLQLTDIRMVLFHQANGFVVGQLARKLGLSDDQAPQNCGELGNTVSASIPLLLMEQMDVLQTGDRVLAVGFGVGLSWGVTLMERVADPDGAQAS
jgi:3-oxoacyl-[acyl-carrier-protein] synthase-3